MSAPLSARLTAGLHQLAAQPLPEDIRELARQSLLNVVGTAVGASRQPAVDHVVEVGSAHGGKPVVGVLGRDEQLDPIGAALANGLAAHLDDFDDTHLATVIHPAAATMAAALSMGVQRGADGHRVLTAFALGCEAQLRIGVAMSPEHYEDGWHITGTVAPLGAAVAAGLVAGLDADQLTHALGAAVSQTLGQREGFGSMLKPFHAGKGAANGVLAVLLVERGLTAPTTALDGPRGYFKALSPRGHRPEQVVEGLGERWELSSNTFKPYPCGVVTHPVIDAAIALSDRVDDADAVEEIVAQVHPLVSDLTGTVDPADGLQARFSTAHGLAAGLMDGRVGLAQYADERVAAPDVTALRRKVRFDVDAASPRHAATVTVRLRDSGAHTEHVPHARGSLERPMTADELAAKVHDLVEPVLPGRTDAIIAAIEDLEAAPSLDALMTAATSKDPR